MAIKSIIQISAEEFFSKENELRRVCSEVVDFDENLKSNIQDLIDTMNNSDIAIGLSFPQIGILDRVLIVYSSRIDSDKYNLKIDDSRYLIMINPRLHEESGKKDKSYESCLSLPGFRAKVERRRSIRVTYQNLEGENCAIHAEKLLARVISHEIDHLNGVLYVDRMPVGAILEPLTAP
ncbi:MAG: peptide deformylase [Rhodothermales bacterium]|nr:peptide deformylase [Rhodothermales bacterium]